MALSRLPYRSVARRTFVGRWWKCFGNHIVKAVSMHNLLNAPCLFCGYSGAGYYQAGTHTNDCPWHNVGGDSERYGKLPGVITALFKERQNTSTNSAMDAIALLKRICADNNVSHLHPTIFDDLQRWQQHQ